MILDVPKVRDFELTGDGVADAWNAASWQPLARVGGEAHYQTRTKVLYSDTGLYVVLDAEDQKLCCTFKEDAENIYTEDVMELFLWPDERDTLYFEYELSPLGVELPILIPNLGGRYFGWLPWHYEGARRTRRATAVRGGDKVSMASISGWSVETFIPFALLTPLRNTPPASGTEWRANVYRIDYDDTRSQWAWCPDTGGNFHDFRNFGVFRFA